MFELAHFAVITRPPGTRASLTDWLPRCIRNAVEPDEDGAPIRHPALEHYFAALREGRYVTRRAAN